MYHIDVPSLMMHAVPVYITSPRLPTGSVYTRFIRYGLTDGGMESQGLEGSLLGIWTRPKIGTSLFRKGGGLFLAVATTSL